MQRPGAVGGVTSSRRRRGTFSFWRYAEFGAAARWESSMGRMELEYELAAMLISTSPVVAPRAMRSATVQSGSDAADRSRSAWAAAEGSKEMISPLYPAERH